MALSRGWTWFLLDLAWPFVLVAIGWTLLMYLYFTRGVVWIHHETSRVVAPPSGWSLWVEMVLPAMLIAFFGTLLVCAPVTVSLSRRVYASARQRWQSLFPASGSVPGRRQRVRLLDATARLAGNPSASEIQVQATFSAVSFDDERAALAARVRGPDGHYVASSSGGGEDGPRPFLTVEETKTLKAGSPQQVQLRVTIPLEELSLPKDLERTPIAVEILILAEGSTLVEKDLPVELGT